MTKRAVLLGYSLSQPSFRHRMQNLAVALEAAGWQLRCEELPSGRYGLRFWERRSLLSWADVAVLHQIKLAALEASLFRRYAPRAVFDFDDAIYVRKPRRLGEPAEESRWRRAKFASTCRHVDTVVAGNAVLASAASPLARAMLVLPTSIDATPYDEARSHAATRGVSELVVVWIGSPENLLYLELARPALRRLAVRFPALRLRIVCSEFPRWEGVSIEPVSWSASIERAALVSADIGIMPLTDDAWARGKCAFKLLQYMAASLPCVASPIGANTEAVIDGITGLHAATAEKWEEALGALLESASLRRRMGDAGRAHVERQYALRSYQNRYVELLSNLSAAK